MRLKSVIEEWLKAKNNAEQQINGNWYLQNKDLSREEHLDEIRLAERSIAEMKKKLGVSPSGIEQSKPTESY